MMTPVMTSTLGRWVATIQWIPAARAIWVMRAIEAWTGRSPRLVRIEALKFKQLVLPEERLTLRLERDAGGALFRFRLGNGDAIISSGRVALDTTPGGGE